MKLVIGNRTWSSWSLRGWLAAKASGLLFDVIYLPLRTEDFRNRIYDYSPSGKVPCLLDGDVAVWDSLAIIDYLVKKAPGSGYWPESLAALGLARSVSAEMHSGFQALRNACPMNLSMLISHFEADEETQADVKIIVDRWQMCRKGYGSGGDFLFGAWSAVDIMFAPVVTRFDTYSLTEDALAREYMEAVLNHPDMLEWIKAAKQEPVSKEYLSDMPLGTLRPGFSQ